MFATKPSPVKSGFAFVLHTSRQILHTPPSWATCAVQFLQGHWHIKGAGSSCLSILRRSPTLIRVHSCVEGCQLGHG